MVVDTPETSTDELIGGEDASGDTSEDAPKVSETFDVVYSCLRCGTHANVTDLERLPEIKCICGFRVFVKNRQPVVKSIKAI